MNQARLSHAYCAACDVFYLATWPTCTKCFQPATLGPPAAGTPITGTPAKHPKWISLPVDLAAGEPGMRNGQ